MSAFKRGLELINRDVRQIPREICAGQNHPLRLYIHDKRISLSLIIDEMAFAECVAKGEPFDGSVEGFDRKRSKWDRYVPKDGAMLCWLESTATTLRLRNPKNPSLMSDINRALKRTDG